MVYKTSNIIFELAFNKFINLKLASGQMGFEDFSSTLDFYVGVSIPDLNAQADVFARELLSRSNFDFKRILKTGYYSSQLTRLRECYIYSFSKGLLYGLNASKVRTLPQRSPIFVGHGIYHRLLSRSRFQMSREDYTLYLNLNIDDATRGEIVKELIDSYQFVGKAIRKNVDGSFDFTDELLDSCLSGLMDASNNMTDSRSFSSQINPFLEGNNSSSNETGKIGELENSNLTTENELYDSKRGNVSKVKAGMRVLEIYDLSDEDLDLFVTSDHLPLGNSAMDANDVSKWWYSCDANEPLRNSINLFFCRANFIYLDGSKSGNSLGFGQTYLEMLPKSAYADPFVTKDVRAITYLNTKSSVSEDSFFRDPKGKKLVGKVITGVTKIEPNIPDNIVSDEDFTVEDESEVK